MTEFDEWWVNYLPIFSPIGRLLLKVTPDWLTRVVVWQMTLGSLQRTWRVAEPSVSKYKRRQSTNEVFGSVLIADTEVSVWGGSQDVCNEQHLLCRPRPQAGEWLSSGRWVQAGRNERSGPPHAALVLHSPGRSPEAFHPPHGNEPLKKIKFSPHNKIYTI